MRDVSMFETQDLWIPFDQIDFNNKYLKQYHIDTRDFHCIVNEKKWGKLQLGQTLKYIERFYWSADEVVLLLSRLYNESGGKKGWRFLSLEGRVNGWDLKYLRIYRTDQGLVVCNSDNYILSKSELDKPVNKELCNDH